MLTKLLRLYRCIKQYFLAITRLDLNAVCEQSKTMGYHDYHDYLDDVNVDKESDRIILMKCKRCGKEFYK